MVTLYSIAGFLEGALRRAMPPTTSFEIIEISPNIGASKHPRLSLGGRSTVLLEPT